ncbi:YgcG family protein [Aquimarina sp. AU474]|uniref:TPM domain-containing protein n=1 Tax=Aquimarina sp. AU474 TaxID=2108529 RepID=UPI000D6876FA|nr:TPM domain-containing protein [Aquimarina sp. AU474]
MKSLQQFIASSLLILGICCLSFNSVYAQREIPNKPKSQTAVYDEAHMLSVSQSKRLEQKLVQYSDTTSTQIVVATINSLQGENIGLYAAEWAHKWGIGQEKEDNGVFVLVAKNDRKIWIATGYGVEEKLTDFTSKTIIDQIITPEFKKGNFYSGLDKGTTAIFEVLDGTFEGSRKKDKSIPITQLVLLLVFFIIIVKAFSKSNHDNNGKGGKGRRSGGDSLLDIIILSNMGRGSFGGGSFGGGSSGGFGGGFGGGGFGGGGAGGSW